MIVVILRQGTGLPGLNCGSLPGLARRKMLGWIRSQEVYDELKKLESQQLEEGIPSMTKDERFEAVLGLEQSAYILGRGAGPNPTTCTAGQRIRAQLERENQEFKRRAKEDRRLFEEMEKEKRERALRLESLESQVASQ